MYNNITKLFSANVSLLVKDQPDAKRTSKYSFYLRRRRFNLSCRIPNNLSICKITSIKKIFPEVSSPFASQYIFSLGGSSLVSFLLYYCGHRAIGSYNFPEKQWFNSSINRVTQTSFNQSNERFPAGHDPGRFSTDRKSTRHNQKKNICISQYLNHSHSGIRFKCSDSLWETGVCRSRIQSVQTWQKILSSAIRFRKSSYCQPQWGTSSGEENKQIRSYPLHGNILAKNPFHNSTVPCPSQNRCRILLLGNSQFLRRKWLWFCHGGSDDFSHKNALTRSKVPCIQSSGKKSNCRILLSASGLEKTLSFHSNAAHNSPGPQPAYAFYIGQIRIPGICNQSGFRPGTCLVLLQTTGCRRNKYQRAKIRLLYKQNPDTQVFRESVPSETAASGLRFVPLVSDVMLTKTISIQNIEMDTTKYFSCTGKIHYTRSQKHTEIPKKPSKRKTVKTDISQCSKSKVIAKIGQFANDLCGCSDELTVKNGSFPHFIGSMHLLVCPKND